MTSDRRSSVPSFVGGDWTAESSSVLNVPRIPAAAHGSRPLPAAHASSGGPLRGVSGGRGSVTSTGIDSALNLTIDEQAPLDCSRKGSSGSGDSAELDDVPTVLNLTTSGQGAAASRGTSTASPDHVEEALVSTPSPFATSPRQNSTAESLRLSAESQQSRSAAGGSTSEATRAEGRRDIETSLNDLEEVDAVGGCLTADDVTAASSRRDLETTRDDLQDVKTEEHMETDVDQSTNIQLSAALQGLLVCHH